MSLDLCVCVCVCRMVELLESYADKLQSSATRRETLQQSVSQTSDVITQDVPQLLKPSVQLVR